MFREFEIKNNETSLYCRKIGSGEPILMIHGGATDSDFFEDVAKGLSKNYEIIIYDRRGYGRNKEAVDKDYSIKTQAIDAQKIIKYINKPCYVLAHSYGGLIAMELGKIEKDLIKEFFIFEPPVYEGINMEDSLLNKQNFLDLIKNEKYDEAIAGFAKNMGKQDERQKPQTKEELGKTYLNIINFLKNEFVLGAYSVDYLAVKNMKVTFCVGELSKKSDLGEGTINLANRLQKQLVYFAGQHNSPYDLPYEFACLLYGMISL